MSVTALTNDVMDQAMRELLDEWEADPSVDALLDNLLSASGDDEDSDDSLSSLDALRVSHQQTNQETKIKSESNATPLKKKKKRGIPRPRRELQHLRQVTQELELQLHVLQQKKQESGATSSSDSSRLVAVAMGPLRQSLWKNVAMRQHRQRRDSELENLRLRASIQEHQTLIRSFSRFLQRGQSALKNRAPNPTKSCFYNIADYDAAVQAALCEELLHTVSHMYITVDNEVTHDPRFARTDPNFRDIAFGRGVGDPVVIVTERRSVPFDAAATAQLVWMFYAWRSTQPEDHPYLNLVNEDTMIKGFQMTLDASRQSRTVQGLIVGRRFVEDDRVVIVWATHITTTNSTDQLPFRYVQGWTVIKQVESEADVKLTHISAKYVVRASIGRDSHDIQRALSTLSSLVLHGIKQHEEMVHRSIENSALASVTEVMT
ncbi:hypothetical protein Poli38472_014083 [Pythium oligandrum]|uniref:Uncharacterized protein n=1 Tax=Pythium oligandrum TaxID=41045 RepID=A0A8K1CN97_PYTOL|nr:hypothetical protein Poli38472_014083 [Pythium oligandrum]|eukprot:TMW66771.1 hypothetical protein Poli38472_014083 [Pythium oligandrum]